MDVGAADPAALDLDVDVVVTKPFGLELESQSVVVEADLQGLQNTSCFLNSVHFFWSSIMNPSKLSG